MHLVILYFDTAGWMAEQTTVVGSIVVRSRPVEEPGPVDGRFQDYLKPTLQKSHYVREVERTMLEI